MYEVQNEKATRILKIYWGTIVPQFRSFPIFGVISGKSAYFHTGKNALNYICDLLFSNKSSSL